MSEAIPDALPFDDDNYNPMSHEEATAMNAVELYILKDLTADQERRFEEHYFMCQECACGVAVEQALAANAAMKVARQPWWRRWAFPVLAPVTAALLGLVTFQGFELSKFNTPLPNTVIVALPLVKGATDEAKAVPTPSVTIEVPLPPDQAPFPFYRVVLIGEAGKPFSQVLPAPEGSRLSMQVLTRNLKSGSYNVSVFGLSKQDSKDGSQVGQYFINIQIKENNIAQTRLSSLYLFGLCTVDSGHAS